MNILIIHPEGNSLNNPTLKCLIDLVEEKGGNLILSYRNRGRPIMKSNKATLYPYGKMLDIFKRLVYDVLEFDFICFVLAYSNVYRIKKEIDVIIGVDRYGLIDAYFISKILHKPYVFISFEIFYEEETSVKFKRIEKKAGSDVSLWIVQDDLRADDVASENNLDLSKKLLIPLASRGLPMTTINRLRDDLKIPVEKKVAIVIGSISKWSMVEKIIQNLQYWSDEWVLIVHERYGDTKEMLSGISSMVGSLSLEGKLYISNKASDTVDEMGFILNGVDLGLAFYLEDGESIYTGKNIRNIGYASGKISTYFRYGVPVITNISGKYSEEILDKKCGILVDHPSDISSHLYLISKCDRGKYAQKFYSDNLDFQKFENKLWSSLKRLYKSHL